MVALVAVLQLSAGAGADPCVPVLGDIMAPELECPENYLWINTACGGDRLFLAKDAFKVRFCSNCVCCRAVVLSCVTCVTYNDRPPAPTQHTLSEHPYA